MHGSRAPMGHLLYSVFCVAVACALGLTFGPPGKMGRHGCFACVPHPASRPCQWPCLLLRCWQTYVSAPCRVVLVGALLLRLVPCGFVLIIGHWNAALYRPSFCVRRCRTYPVGVHCWAGYSISLGWRITPAPLPLPRVPFYFASFRVGMCCCLPNY